MQLGSLIKISFIFLNFFQQLKCQMTQQINVLFINEVGNDIAQKAFEVAINYLKKTPSLHLSVESTMIEGNKNDTKKFLETFCSTFGEMIKSKKPPHIIFDATKSGNTSETVKSFSAGLGIPIISTSYGHPRQWKNLTDIKKKYLLQVLPPADILTESVHAILNYMKITNAAVLHGENFVLDHKNATLFPNITTHHIIESIAETESARTEQIKKIKGKDIKNFFVLGNNEEIKQVLEAAPKEFFSREFAWHAITEDRHGVAANVENVTLMVIQPKPDEKSKDRLETMKTTYNMKYEPEIESAFYFDMALKTFLSVRNILQQGLWPPNMKYLTCDEYDGTNSPNHTMDLASVFREVTEPPTYAPFEFAKADVPFNGHSFMKFDVKIWALTIKDRTSFVLEGLGTWTAGFNNELNIESVKEMKKLAAN